MAERKAYFEIYGERARARSRQTKRSGKNTPGWFPYKLEELSGLNPLKRFLNVGGLPVSIAEEKEGFMKNIKKTKAQQIGYLLEDMDEEVRRLKNAVLYVGFCNRQLKMVLKNEENELETDVSSFQNLLRSSTFSNNQEGENGKIEDNENYYEIGDDKSKRSKKRKIIDPFEEFESERIRDNKIDRGRNYLLRQLQRQLLEMNGRLKSMKMEANDLKKIEEHRHLVELKKQIKNQKEMKKENMIKMHKVNERFMQRQFRQQKLQDLKHKYIFIFYQFLHINLF